MSVFMKRGIAVAAIVSGLLADASAAAPQVGFGDAGHLVMFVPVWIPPLEGAPTGGVQLDVDPRGAQVYVDGKLVGLIREFSGYYKHLEIAAGPHLVTIIAPDYEPLIVPVLVSPGRTMTFRGTLTRAYGR
jgi:PEGA domain